MRQRPLFLAALFVGLACVAGSGCRGDTGSDDQMGDDGVDPGDDDPIPDDGCSALSPRDVAAETFVGPMGLQQRMTQMIDGAQDTLDIAMYLWTVQAIASRVVAAQARGVTVRVLLDPDHEGNGTVRSMLTNGGVTHRNAPSLYSFSHAKYMLIDGDTAVIMSMNWNVDAMDNERNFGMIDRDPADVEDLQAIFNQDWAHSANETPVPADLSCTRLVVSPTNAKARLIEHINSADETLELEIMYLSEQGIRDAVIAAAERDVAVRVILTDDADESIPALKAAGALVKTATSYYNHAKLITADGIPFVGSENMSFTSLTRNREVGALITEDGPAEIINDQFEADWNAGLAL
jgi:phosphatidylserine/phosphatidylglycerophosphate/cardiolipin synthase-like enzyme